MAVDLASLPLCATERMVTSAAVHLNTGTYGLFVKESAQSCAA